MPDLTQLLREAAGDPPDLPDVEAIIRRARPRVLRRRVATGLTALVVGLAGWGTASIVLHEDTVLRVDGADRGAASRDRTVELREGQLEPRTYTSRVGEYAVRLTTRSDVWGAAVVEPGWVALTFRQYVLHLQVWDRVVSPRAGAAATLVPPDDLARWLEQHPRLSSGRPTTVDVGGVAATRLDVRVVDPLASTPRECTARCVVLARVGGDGELVDLEVGEHTRFLVVGPPGDQLVVFYRAPEREFAVLDGAVAELLAGLRLDGPG